MSGSRASLCDLTRKCYRNSTECCRLKIHSKLYPKYSKFWLSSVAHAIDCVWNKILNSGLNPGLIHGLFISLFSFFGWKSILNQLENSGLKSRFLFCLICQSYLMYRLICQKPAYSLSAQMALVSTFFQMFLVLGMYNFGLNLTFLSAVAWEIQNSNRL